MYLIASILPSFHMRTLVFIGVFLTLLSCLYLTRSAPLNFKFGGSGSSAANELDLGSLLGSAGDLLGMFSEKAPVPVEPIPGKHCGLSSMAESMGFSGYCP